MDDQYKVLTDNLLEIETSDGICSGTIEECQKAIAYYFDMDYPYLYYHIVSNDKNEEIVETWYWCETCGTYNTEHCPCVRAELDYKSGYQYFDNQDMGR
jgi:hypothetical protein